MVSHNPKEIVEYCSHCIWLDRGEIKLIGPVKDVESAYYYQLTKEVWERDYIRPLSKTTSETGMPFIPYGDEYVVVTDFIIHANTVSSEITYDSGVLFSVHIEKKQTGLFLHPAIRIYDYLMNEIMLLIPQAEPVIYDNINSYKDRIGKIKYVTSLQPQILVKGIYYAELWFSKNLSSDQLLIIDAIKIPNKVCFEVKKGAIPFFEIGNNTSIKPHCDWEITLIE